MAVRSTDMVAVATFLLDRRRISPAEQDFLITLGARARKVGPRLALTSRQSTWLRSIVERHAEAIAGAGLQCRIGPI